MGNESVRSEGPVWWVRIAGCFAAVECLALQKLSASAHVSPLLLVAILAVDLALFAWLSHTFVARPRGGFRALALRPRHALAGLLCALVLHRLVAPRLALPSVPMRGALAFASLELFVLLVAGVLGWQWFRARGSAESVPFSHRFEAALGSVLPAPLAAMFVSELVIVHAALRALSRRPRRSPAGFSLLESSSYPKLVFALLLLSSLEAPATHLLASALAHGHAFTVHLILLFVHGYTFLWLIGDLRLLRESRHACEAHGIQLSLGARARAFVPYQDIVEVRSTVPERTPHLRITPMDTANVVLVLKVPAKVESMFGLTKHTACIALYVDDPAGFRSELARYL
jgi:hypothetical protein